MSPSASSWSQYSRRSQGTSSRSCLCSPTSHPGSFRCSFHRNDSPSKASAARPPLPPPPPAAAAMAKLVPLSGTSCLVRRALLSKGVRPPSRDLHKLHRDFEAKPTRFSLGCSA